MTHPLETQQTRVGKAFKALGREEKNDICNADLVQEMAADMANPSSAESAVIVESNHP